MVEKTSPPSLLLGLLECPFRRGYIEFEYEAGDTTAELREQIASMWGSPTALGKELHYGGLWDEGVWAILCEDETGAYFPLRDNDQIPIGLPGASSEVRKSTIDRTHEQKWHLPQGVIHELDVRVPINVVRIEYDKYEPHLRLELHREYEIPKDKTYSVKLLALIVIAGG